jgi:hypothetical protein
METMIIPMSIPGTNNVSLIPLILIVLSFAGPVSKLFLCGD